MKTIVTYKKDGVTYTHTFTGNIMGSEAERRMIMEFKIGRSQIVSIVHK